MRFFVLILVFGTVVFCQTGNISGKIYSKYSNDVLVGANIHFKGTNSGVASDIEGAYKIENVKPGKYVLSCEYNGCKTQTDSIKVKPNESLIVNFLMKQDGKTKEIEIKNKQKSDYKFKLLNKK